MAKLSLCLWFLLLALVCGLALARPSTKKTTTPSADKKKNVPQELTLNSDLSSLVLVRKSGLALSSPRGGKSHISPDYRLLRSPRYFGPQEVEFGSIEDSEDWGIPTRGRRYKIVTSSSSKKRQQPWQKRQRDDDDDDDDEEDDESAEDDDGSEEDDLVAQINIKCDKKSV
jgi:hypothetical protein